MSRAQGKHPQRGGILAGLAEDLAGGGEQESAAEQRQEGIGDPRDIPGGKKHLANPPVTRQAVPVPATEWPYRDAMLAHGVQPDEAGHWPRDPRLTGAQRGRARTEAPPPAATPVPVYLVEKAGGGRAKAFTGTRRITLPAAGSEPAQIVQEQPNRSLVQLLNEDASHNARFGQLEDLSYDTANSVITGGSRLPSGASGYTVLRTHGALWGVSETSSTVVISVITEFEIAGAL